MKVIEINAVYGKKSTGLVVHDISNLLRDSGEEVRYVFQYGDCSNSKEYYQFGNLLDWKLHALYTRLSGKQGYGSYLATKRLLKYIKQELPDIVHLHNLHANYINLPLLLKYLAKENIATVVTLHDCWFFTGKCCHFTSMDCNKWKTGCGNCPKLKEAPKSLLFDNTNVVAKDKKELFEAIQNLTIVGCSKWIADIAKESYVFRNCNIKQIYNGVDTNVFHLRDKEILRNKYNIEANFIVLGMANKWLDNRNASVMNKVVDSLKENELLILIGCTKDQIDKYSNNRKVLCIDYISDRNKLAEYYSLSDVFVNLTFEDTLPTVNMESICCGTPVITYDSCGSPELIDKDTGRVIKQLDINSLLTELDNIRKNKFNNIKCSEIGINRFDKNKRYLDYIDLFNSIYKQG